VHEAGEKLFVDFAGDRMEYVDRETGEIIKCRVFVACLPYSDYTFCLAVRSQTTEDFLYALSRCLEHLGGAPKILVPDNLKAAVVKTDRYEPKLNDAMEDFANHYRLVVIPARPYHPKDKAKVEGSVKIIYTRVYAKLRNQRFFSLEELNAALAEKTMEHNQTRMKNCDYSRRERFIADEKDKLRPLPETAYEMKHYANLTVLNNCHVQLQLGRDRHYYSVPYIYIGEKVQVIYTRSLVKIFCRQELVATHARTLDGKYTTATDHLCSAHRFYNKRGPEFYIKTAGKKSDVLKEFITAIFGNSNQPPEFLYKTCDGLLALARQADADRLDKACRIAMDAGKYSYRYVRSLIESKAPLTEEPDGYKPLPETGNARGKNYYK
jgi:hypothetical protein